MEKERRKFGSRRLILVVPHKIPHLGAAQTAENRDAAPDE